MGLLDLILHNVFGKLFSEDTVDAMDLQKWGQPMTEGEGHYINDLISNMYYEHGGHGEQSLKSALWLSNVYEHHLQEQFGYFRRGWVVEYMGDAYAQNAFERFTFVLLARVPVVRGIVINIYRTTKHLSRDETTIGPTSMLENFYAVGWATLTFYLGQAVVGALITEAFLQAPVTFLTTYPIVLGGFLLAATTWYGKYGLWLPVMGVQSIGSALSWVGLWVMSIVVAIRFASGVPVIGSMLESGAVAFFNVGGTNIPNPLFLGLGPFMEGMIRGDGALGAVLLLWGLAGVGNAFYAELEEAHSKKAKQAKRISDLVARKVKREVGGG